MINAPVLHVNGDYPQGEHVRDFAYRYPCLIMNKDVAKAMDIAFRYRNYFRKDIIVDLLVYRRW